jgi:hypothetical protein
VIVVRSYITGFILRVSTQVDIRGFKFRDIILDDKVCMNDTAAATSPLASPQLVFTGLHRIVLVHLQCPRDPWASGSSNAPSANCGKSALASRKHEQQIFNSSSI